MKVVKRVKLDSLIGNEEDLFSKQTGDFGANFSGGEKQKILLSRALINKAEIMLFDEIESALDRDSEKIFIDILNNELRDSTVICVTHKNINNEIFDKKYNLSEYRF